METTSIQVFIEKGIDRWADCDGLPEMTLLRFGLLRELLQKLHSNKSKCLAQGQKEEAQTIKKLEVRINDLRDHVYLSGELATLIEETNTSIPISKKKRILPEALFLRLDREKFLRYDRQWEVAIAFEAISLNWQFWSLDTWIEISQLDEWEKLLSLKLWPHGLILFSGNAPQDDDPADQKADLWHGNWVIVLHPHFKNPTELSLNLDQQNGASASNLYPAHWKLLFP